MSLSYYDQQIDLFNETDFNKNNTQHSNNVVESHIVSSQRDMRVRDIITFFVYLPAGDIITSSNHIVNKV